MKKTILIAVFSFMVSNICFAQEWFTSFDIAKRLAIVQNKMLFVMWEGSMDYEFPVLLFDDKGRGKIVDLTTNDSITRMIWENFVPVRLPEYEYAKFSKQVKETRGLTYYNKLIDDGIKIMDINGNILNTDDSIDSYYSINDYDYLVINDFIKRYALNTSYLKLELENYSKEKNFNSAFWLASKYVDYATFVEKDLRAEIVDLANIYFDDAKRHLTESGDNNEAYFQRVDLEHLKELLILNEPRKVRRTIKKMDAGQIADINQQLFAFLNYTVYRLLKDEKKANAWKSKVSSIDLKRANLILNINLPTHGTSN